VAESTSARIARFSASERVGHALTTARRSASFPKNSNPKKGSVAGSEVAGFSTENGKPVGKTRGAAGVTGDFVSPCAVASPVLKTGVGATRPGVRIPPSPLTFQRSSHLQAASRLAFSFLIGTFDCVKTVPIKPGLLSVVA